MNFDYISEKWQGDSFSAKCSTEYSKKKYKELKVLASFVNNNVKVEAPKNYLDVFHSKIKLRNEIRKKHVGQFFSSESFIYGDTPTIHNIEFKYIYQRLGWDFVNTRPLQSIYKNIKINHIIKDQGFFTSSCQNAISVFLLALQHTKPNMNILVPRHLYWETTSAFQLTKNKIVHHLDPNSLTNIFAAYFDTSTQQKLFDDNYLKQLSQLGCKLIMIDSTCLDSSSNVLAELINKIINFQMVPILFRSHLKLDCLGMEYGRLGSIIMLMPEALNQQQTDVDDLWEAFKRLAIIYGTYSCLTQIYPFLWDNKFTKVNSNWIQQLETCNQFVTNELQNYISSKSLSSLKLISFAHQKFFWIYLSNNYANHVLSKVMTNLRESLHLMGIPHFSIASYPWDFVAVTFFKPQQNFDTTLDVGSVIRISIPDYDPIQIENIVSAIKFWLVKTETYLEKIST